MINVITQHGSSFKGLASYLLADIDRRGDERVAWTETHGLATDDVSRATKIMISTAKSQADLQAEAGIANTGRKSHKHVMHYVLSWHPDERDTLTKDEMLAAAKASMTYMGVYEGEKLGVGLTKEGYALRKEGVKRKDLPKRCFKDIIAKRTQHADEHQAIIVCHDDGPDKPLHVHVMLNRCHPQHGVMLPDSKDFEKLSTWALDYRRAQGKEYYCPERSKAAAKKAQGIVTNNPRKPRNIYEQEKAMEAAEPGSRRKALLEQQIKKAQQLKTKHEAMKQDQAKQMHALEDRHVAAERAERTKTTEAIKVKTAEIRAAYAPKFDALLDRQAQEIQAFQEAKGTAVGHARNAWAAFKTKAWMTEIRTRPLEAMKHGFGLAFSSGLQQRDIEKQHARELGELRGARVGEERDAARGLKTDQGFRLDDLRQAYHEQRNDLILTHGMDTAKIKTEWHQLGRDRLASQIEDQRTQDAKAQAERGDTSGGKQPSQRSETSPLADQAPGFEPANDNAYDIPIDELRAIGRELQDMALDDEQEQEIEQDEDYEYDR